MTLPRVAVRILSILFFLLGLMLSVAASLVASYQIAKITPRIGLLVLVALLVFSIGIALVSKLVGLLGKTFLNRSALWTSGMLTVFFAITLYLAFLRPTHYPHIAPVPRANTQYWNLSTGSRIAYSVYEPPAGMNVKTDPIVFVHGGPGFRAFDTDHDFYRRFTQDGFKVYLYDQAGSGLSDRLPHASDYTVERFVADLESIRQQIGAQHLILIGHSWGGTLVAHYAAAHPDHVAKLIFHSPGPISHWTTPPFDYQRTDAKAARRIPPARMLAATALSHADWDAAEHLASEDEFGDWELAASDPGELVCKGQRSKVPVSFTAEKLAGLNIYPLLALNRELNDKPEMDVRPQLSKLRVPAIALESECEFVPWTAQLQYKNAIPGLKEFYFPDSGHYINFSQPEKMAAVIHSFLLDQPPPFPAYPDDTDPRPTAAK